MSKKKEKKPKFYAIKVGHECNKIVTTWAECQKLTNHCPGVKFKSFYTKDEAEEYLFGTPAKAVQTKINDKAAVSSKSPTKPIKKKGKFIKLTIDSSLYEKFDKLCGVYEVDVDTQIQRLIKEWTDLY